MAHAADWYTSIAAIAGVTVENSGPKPADGVQLFDAIFSNAPSPRVEVVLQIVSTNAENDYTLYVEAAHMVGVTALFLSGVALLLFSLFLFSIYFLQRRLPLFISSFPFVPSSLVQQA